MKDTGLEIRSQLYAGFMASPTSYDQANGLVINS